MIYLLLNIKYLTFVTYLYTISDYYVELFLPVELFFVIRHLPLRCLWEAFSHEKPVSTKILSRLNLNLMSCLWSHINIQTGKEHTLSLHRNLTRTKSSHYLIFKLSEIIMRRKLSFLLFAVLSFIRYRQAHKCDMMK